LHVTRRLLPRSDKILDVRNLPNTLFVITRECAWINAACLEKSTRVIDTGCH
jgi:hypothetical protein